MATCARSVKRVPFPQSHGSSAKSECHKLPPESNKSASGSQCRHQAPNSQGLGEKGSHFGKRPQTLEPSDRTYFCPYLLGFRSGPEAEHTRAPASDRRQRHLGWLFVQQGADHRQLLQGYGNANMEKAAGHSLSSGMEKGIITDFAK